MAAKTSGQIALCLAVTYPTARGNSHRPLPDTRQFVFKEILNVSLVMASLSGLENPQAPAPVRPVAPGHGAAMTAPTYQIAVSGYPLERKLPPGDPSWNQFNASFENKEYEPVDIANAVYFGHAITTWHKDHWRAGKNYLSGQHIGLDFDTGDNLSSIPHLKSDKFISKYGAFLYTTMSHTEEAPRARAIFLLDKPIMQSSNYTLAAAALLWLFGSADRQCKDAVRFFYGSPDCTMEMLGNVLPLEVVKRLIANYQETGAKEKRKSTRSDYHAPASQQEVEEALRMIPPLQIEYDEWLAVLMAIHSQFGDGGLALAESWGEGKGDEISRKWKSFNEAGNSSGAITIASVFGLAKRYGWKRIIN